MNWEYLLTFLGSIGILEIAKFLYNLIIRRRTDARLAAVEAKSSELTLLQTAYDWLQERLQRELERYENLASIARKQDMEILRLTRELAQKDIDMAKTEAGYQIQLVELRCDDKVCPYRQPPNAYTPPKPENITKQDYLSQKIRALPQT